MPEPKFPLQSFSGSQENLFLVSYSHCLIIWCITWVIFQGLKGGEGKIMLDCILVVTWKKICCIIWLLPNPITSPPGWSPASYSLITSMLQWPWGILDSDHFLFSKPFLHKISLTFWSHNGKTHTQPFVRADLSKRSHWFCSAVCFLFIRKLPSSEGMTVNCFLCHVSHCTFIIQLFQKLFERNSFWFFSLLDTTSLYRQKQQLSKSHELLMLLTQSLFARISVSELSI